MGAPLHIYVGVFRMLVLIPFLLTGNFLNVYNIFHCYLILFLLFITRIFSEGNVYNFVNDLMENIGRKRCKLGESWKIKSRKSYARKVKKLENREKTKLDQSRKSSIFQIRIPQREKRDNEGEKILKKQ